MSRTPLPLGIIPIYQPGNAFFQPHFRLPAEDVACFGNIGVIGEHISLIGWMALENGLSADPLFEQGDQDIDRDTFMPAQVDDLLAERLQDGNRPTGNVVH